MSFDERIEADTSAQPHHARIVAQEQSDRPARRDSAAPVGGVSRTRRGGVSFGKTAAVRGACVNWDGKIANEGRGGIERTGSQKISDSLHESPERSLFRPQRSWLREDRSSSPLRKAGEDEEEEGSSEASPMPPRMADTSKIRRVSKESDEGGILHNTIRPSLLSTRRSMVTRMATASTTMLQPRLMQLKSRVTTRDSTTTLSARFDALDVTIQPTGSSA